MFDPACNCRKNESDNVANQNFYVTTAIESNSSGCLSEVLKMQENEHYQTVTSVNTESDSNNDNSVVNHLFPFADFMDTNFPTPITHLLTCSQTDELSNMYDADSNQQLVSNCTYFHLKNIYVYNQSSKKDIILKKRCERCTEQELYFKFTHK